MTLEKSRPLSRPPPFGHLKAGVKAVLEEQTQESPWAGPLQLQGPILPTPVPGMDPGSPSTGMSLRPPYPCRKKPELVRSPMVPLPMPKKLRFNITPEVKSDIEKAKQNLSM